MIYTKARIIKIRSTMNTRRINVKKRAIPCPCKYEPKKVLTTRISKGSISTVRLYLRGTLPSTTDLRNYVRESKHSGCVVCNEGWPPILHYHHVYPSTKLIEINQMVDGRYTIDEIQREIDKCVILCYNCHYKVHTGGMCLL